MAGVQRHAPGCSCCAAPVSGCDLTAFPLTNLTCLWRYRAMNVVLTADSGGTSIFADAACFERQVVVPLIYQGGTTNIWQSANFTIQDWGYVSWGLRHQGDPPDSNYGYMTSCGAGEIIFRLRMTRTTDFANNRTCWLLSHQQQQSGATTFTGVTSEFVDLTTFNQSPLFAEFRMITSGAGVQAFVCPTGTIGAFSRTQWQPWCDRNWHISHTITT